MTTGCIAGGVGVLLPQGQVKKMVVATYIAENHSKLHFFAVVKALLRRIAVESFHFGNTMVVFENQDEDDDLTTLPDTNQQN